jgi:hypothetical protein
MEQNLIFKLSKDRALKDIEDLIETWKLSDIDPSAAVTTLLAESILLTFMMTESKEEAKSIIYQYVAKITDDNYNDLNNCSSNHH